MSTIGRPYDNYVTACNDRDDHYHACAECGRPDVGLFGNCPVAARLTEVIGIKLEEWLRDEEEPSIVLA